MGETQNGVRHFLRAASPTPMWPSLRKALRSRLLPVLGGNPLDFPENMGRSTAGKSHLFLPQNHSEVTFLL